MANPRIRVTKIKNHWHARLYLDDKVFEEMACELKCDIGWICRECLRWYDKLGGTSLFADAARTRQNKSKPVGKVWFVRE